VVSKSRICGPRGEELSGLEGLLEVMSLEVTTGSDEQVTTTVSPAATAPLYWPQTVYDFL